MAFCIHDPLVPLTGGVSGGVLPAELQNFLYPPPPLLIFTHPVCKTLCMYVRSHLSQFGVVGGRGVLLLEFEKGYSRRKRRDFYYLVGGRSAIFLRIAGFICPCIALLSGVRFTPKLYPFDIVTTWTGG